MEENIEKLKKIFNRIKNMELSESLRSGTTGLGYTFETLIGKREDNKTDPDFLGIEIKTKLGYTKSPLTLFTLVPLKENKSSIKFILNNFGYPDKNKKLRSFRGNVFCNFNNIIANKYIFKLCINKKNQKLELIIYNLYMQKINNEIYWDLSEIKKRLFTKLNYLALIKGYPYIRNNQKFYKYTYLSIYKVKNFETFLKLIEEDKIFIVFNIGMHKSADRFGQICDRGTAFRIKQEYLEELFDKIE